MNDNLDIKFYDQYLQIIYVNFLLEISILLTFFLICQIKSL